MSISKSCNERSWAPPLFIGYFMVQPHFLLTPREQSPMQIKSLSLPTAVSSRGGYECMYFMAKILSSFHSFFWKCSHPKI